MIHIILQKYAASRLPRFHLHKSQFILQPLPKKSLVNVIAVDVVCVTHKTWILIRDTYVSEKDEEKFANVNSSIKQAPTQISRLAISFRTTGFSLCTD